MAFLKSIISLVVFWTVLCGFAFIFSLNYLKSISCLPLLIWLFGLPVVIIAPKFFMERKKQRDELEPFFKELGFTEGQPRIGTIGNWNGVYRARNFSIWLVRSRGLYLGPAPIKIETPNKTGKELYIKLDEPEKMRQNALDSIYQRFEKVRLSKELTDPFEPIRFKSGNVLDKSQLTYGISGYLASRQNLKELLDAICDTMDRLGV